MGEAVQTPSKRAFFLWLATAENQLGHGIKKPPKMTFESKALKPKQYFKYQRKSKNLIDIRVFSFSKKIYIRECLILFRIYLFTILNN